MKKRVVVYMVSMIHTILPVAPCLPAYTLMDCAQAITTFLYHTYMPLVQLAMQVSWMKHRPSFLFVGEKSQQCDLLVLKNVRVGDSLFLFLFGSEIYKEHKSFKFKAVQK